MTPSLTLEAGSIASKRGASLRETVTRVLTLACQPIPAFALFLLAGILIYLPALGGDLVWDDQYLVRENPFFRSPVFLTEVFRHYLFLDSFSIYYRPIQNWSYLLDYWLWHGDTVGYHLTNILLHSVGGFMLYRLLRRIFGQFIPTESGEGGKKLPVDGLALLTALLWVVHPVHNAAVAYISGRADSLACVFALGAWLIYFRALEAKAQWKRVGSIIISALLLLLSLCSKEIALMWMALFLWTLLLDRQRRTWKDKAVIGAVLGCVLGIYTLLHSLPGRRAAMEDAPTTQLEERPLLMLRALGDYTSLMFYPGRLYMERKLSEPLMYKSSASWISLIRFEYLSVIGLLAVLGAGWLCARKWAGQRLRIYGAGWFLLAFLPISNLFPLNAEVAEHWIYLASIGFLVFVAGWILAAPARHYAAWGLAAGLAVALLGARTWLRAGDWINAETFCLRTINDGGATPRILNTLAAVYGDRRDYERQEKVIRKTMKDYPDFAPARIALGTCLSKQGRLAEAEPLLAQSNAESGEVSKRYARTWPGTMNYALLRAREGHQDEAIAILQDAETRFPDTWEIVKTEAGFLQQKSGPAAALPGVERFAAAHWWHADSWMILGSIRFGCGQPDASVTAFREAARLDIYNPKPLGAIAELEMQRGRPEAALEEQIEAVSRARKDPRQLMMLASIYDKLGRKEESAETVRRAQESAKDVLGHY